MVSTAKKVLRSMLQAAGRRGFPLRRFPTWAASSFNWIGSIAAIARIAPLLGLLGTVVGMVGAFFALQDEGAYAHIGVLAAGFGEALITTGTGLAIAIMAQLAHHFLHDRVRALVHDMEWAGHQIMQFLLHEMSEEEPETARTPASEAVKSNPEE
ncbi:MotA/TolQ/ExbB proton channel family protein [Candidatus Sumerlaeota bacterium]|nr:MotA/TolQ/ExbB proton channel family protein [Candidatus Sumerlaeota bacterium]